MILTPSVITAIDHRDLDSILGTMRGGSIRIAYVQHGLNIGYILSTEFKLPETIGSWSLAGFLCFIDALGNAQNSRVMQDEFFSILFVEQGGFVFNSLCRESDYHRNLFTCLLEHETLPASPRRRRDSLYRLRTPSTLLRIRGVFLRSGTSFQERQTVN